MYIKFIKKHSVGIKEGLVAKVNESFGEKMLNDGYAKKSSEKDFETFKAKHYGTEEKKTPSKKGKKKVKS